MARIKGGMNAKKKHNRVLKLAKGYRGARSKQYRVAKQSVMRALTSSYAGRKQKKRQFRQLWIARINAAAKAKEKYPELPIEGEIQFDAAVSPRVARTKCKDSQVAGHANTFVFPDINAGNIGYKIAQRLGNFEAYGPILLGLNAPINDLSRGCNASEVYSMAIITAALA